MKKTTKKTTKRATPTKRKSKVQYKSKKGPLYYFGNLLIVTSLFISFIIFYPVVATYLFPKHITPQNLLVGNYITIPKINAQAPLLLNVNPWNETEYKRALKLGVAQAKGTYLPGEKGRSFLFAHSSGNPLEETQYNTVFLRLGELKIGDEIDIKRDEKVYKYTVTSTKIVWPTDVEYLKKSEAPGIIIQTCWPIGTSLKRLLVFAAPSQ